MPQPQQQSSEPSLRQKMAFVKWLMFFPALTAMLLFRRNLGYRALSPGGLVAVCLVMVLLANWLSAETPFAEMLLIYTAGVFLEGVSQRLKRWREMRRGVKQHSYFIGDSQLRKLWLPAFLKCDRRVERFIDPLFAVAIGFPVAKYFSPALGGWLVFSGLCLRTFEAEVWKKKITHELDTIDSMVESEIQEEVVEHYSVRIENQSGRSVNGIPTGCSADIQKTILRRAKRVSRE
jgi:hypothetical protein